MKYGLLTLLLIFALPGCSCMRKGGDKKDKMHKMKKPTSSARMKTKAKPKQKMEKRMKKPAAPVRRMPKAKPMMPAQMPAKQDFVPEMMDMDMAMPHESM